MRAERPYTVVTEARFESIARALDEFLNRLDLVAEARLEAEDDRMRLTFSYRWRYRFRSCARSAA